MMERDFAENYPAEWDPKISGVNNTNQPWMVSTSWWKKGDNIPWYDAFAVSVFEDVAIDHLKDKSINVASVHQWCDGYPVRTREQWDGPTTLTFQMTMECHSPQELFRNKSWEDPLWWIGLLYQPFQQYWAISDQCWKHVTVTQCPALCD